MKCPSMKIPQRALSPLLSREDTVRRQLSSSGKRALTRPSWHPDFRLPASRTVDFCSVVCTPPSLLYLLAQLPPFPTFLQNHSPLVTRGMWALNPQHLCMVICPARGNDYLSCHCQQGLIPASTLNSVLTVDPFSLAEL